MTTMKIPSDLAKKPISKYAAEKLILPGDEKAEELVKILQLEDQPDYRLFVHTRQNFSEFWREREALWRFPTGTIPVIMADMARINNRSEDEIVAYYNTGMIIIDDFGMDEFIWRIRLDTRSEEVGTERRIRLRAVTRKVVAGSDRTEFIRRRVELGEMPFAATSEVATLMAEKLVRLIYLVPTRKRPTILGWDVTRGTLYISSDHEVIEEEEVISRVRDALLQGAWISVSSFFIELVVQGSDGDTARIFYQPRRKKIHFEMQ